MNEEKDQKPKGHEQDFSDFAKHPRPELRKEGRDRAGSFRRGCGMAVAIASGVVALAFFLIAGVCFIGK